MLSKGHLAEVHGLPLAVVGSRGIAPTPVGVEPCSDIVDHGTWWHGVGERQTLALHR